MERTDIPMLEHNYGLTLAKLAEDIQLGCVEAVEGLYQILMPGLKGFLRMRVPRDYVEDYCHDVFMSVLRFIRSGAIRDLRCLPGVVRTIALRVIANHKKTAVSSEVSVDSLTIEGCVPDHRANFENNLQRQERMEIALAALSALSERDREILRRFYLEEQTEEQIRTEMGLTETQFRLIKSRAKMRFGELGRKHLRRRLQQVA